MRWFDTADGMLGLIRQGGGTVVEIPAAGGTDAKEAGVDSGAGGAAFEGAENVGEDEGIWNLTESSCKWDKIKANGR